MQSNRSLEKVHELSLNQLGWMIKRLNQAPRGCEYIQICQECMVFTALSCVGKFDPIIYFYVILISTWRLHTRLILKSLKKG
jgi:hypothetical protein